MVTRVFDDEIVSATKFRTSQSYWLSVASKRPVTVTTGDKKVIVFSRERMRELYIGRDYLELAVRLYDELERNQKNTILYWLEYLDVEDRKLFIKEFINNILISITTSKWDNVEELLEDWKATAETENNPDVMKALKTKIRKDEYITIK